MKRFYETAVILIGTLGWWGYVYPELSLTQQAYVQETETNRLTEADGVTESNRQTESEAEETVRKKAEYGRGRKDAGKSNSSEDDEATGILEELGSTGIEVGEIRIKSRIAEYVYQVKKDMVEKGAEDD